MKILSIIILFLICHPSKSQFIACGYSWAEKYQVNAKSGLNLRAEQNLKSTKVGLIPFKSEIRLCYDSAKSVTIDGIKGKWVKAYWQNKEGFIFDGYVGKMISGSKISGFSPEMDLRSEWGQWTFSINTEYLGLYATDNPTEFELKKIELKENKHREYSPPVNINKTPIWVFSKLEISEPKIIHGKIVNRMIFIGEKLKIENGILYGDGKAVKADSTVIGVFKELDPYELRVQARLHDKIIDQLLLKMKCWGGVRQIDGYEARAIVNFIGDIDGDNKEDIIITYQNTYKGWYHGFFSTLYAAEGRIYKEIIIGMGSE
jgi:hypothetical protein